jgi:hypothetical protein
MGKHFTVCDRDIGIYPKYVKTDIEIDTKTHIHTQMEGEGGVCGWKEIKKKDRNIKGLREKMTK